MFTVQSTAKSGRLGEILFIKPQAKVFFALRVIVQELCESRGGRPGLSVLTSILVSVDVKLY